MVIGFLVAFLVVFGVFFFVNRGGNGSSAGHHTIRAGGSSSHCNGDQCSLR